MQHAVLRADSLSDAALPRNSRDALSPPVDELSTAPQHGHFNALHSSPGQRRGIDSDLSEAGELYLTWCHKQPLALFDETTFIETLPLRDQVLCQAIKGIGLRFSPNISAPAQHRQLDELLCDARRTIWRRLADGEIELSSLQTLCLICARSFVGMSTEGRI